MKRAEEMVEIIQREEQQICRAYKKVLDAPESHTTLEQNLMAQHDAITNLMDTLEIERKKTEETVREEAKSWEIDLGAVDLAKQAGLITESRKKIQDDRAFMETQQTAKQKAEERRRQAKIILDVLAEDAINMNWNYEDEYIAAIMKGLKRIEDEKENDKKEERNEVEEP